MLAQRAELAACARLTVVALLARLPVAPLRVALVAVGATTAIEQRQSSSNPQLE